MVYEGRNINVTLLFAVQAYEQVAEAYIRALERRLAEGKTVDVRSVASFFVSRVDTEVDKRLEGLDRPDLRGRAGLANARAAYLRFKSIFRGERFAELAAAGASVQRPLWASTGVKDPSYPDTMYVDGLVGPDTVNTMPMATLMAAADHATVSGATAELDPEADLRALAEAGIDLDDVTAQLLREGVEKFVEPFEKLFDVIESRREAIFMSRPPTVLGSIPDEIEPRIAAGVANARSADVAHRVWKKDETLWGSAGEAEIADRLGWLTVADQMREAVPDLEAFAAEVQAEGTTDVVLLGMGGSSLAPEVMRQSFAGEREQSRKADYPELHVLDSTDAGAIRAIEEAIDLEQRAFLVSTKSGGTIETLSLFRYFWGRRPDGRAFVAITDPGSGLEELASEHGFRRTYLNDPNIGGRYSALSYFGLVPAALMGADVEGLLDRAGIAEQNCLTFDAADANSGLWLGLAWGELALAGRDKLTYVINPPLRELRALGRAAARRVDRQGRQGDRPGRRRAARRAGRLRRRPHARLPPPRGSGGRGDRRARRCPRQSRCSGDHPHRPRPDGSRAAVLLRRVRRRGRRLGARPQSFRPARRRGRQEADRPGPRDGRGGSARRRR